MSYYYLDCIKYSLKLSLPMLRPKLNIDIRNWSQDMWVLKGGNLEKQKNPPLVGIEDLRLFT